MANKRLKNINFSKTLWEAFLQFIYPSFCLHCAEPTRHGAGIFCLSCTTQLELINPQERCPYCFSADFDAERRICYPCFMEASSFKRCAAVFDYQGPAATLVLKMKYAQQTYLADGAGAYLAVQFMQLGWPMPDLIVPVPLTLVHRISRGYNQSFLLAEALGKIVDRPVHQILRRRSLDYSQAGMSKGQRLKLDAEAFSIKEHPDIRDKVILLVDDVMTTGQTMNCCAKVLYQGFPKAVYGISLCRAL